MYIHYLMLPVCVHIREILRFIVLIPPPIGDTEEHQCWHHCDKLGSSKSLAGGLWGCLECLISMLFSADGGCEGDLFWEVWGIIAPLSHDWEGGWSEAGVFDVWWTKDYRLGLHCCFYLAITLWVSWWWDVMCKAPLCDQVSECMDCKLWTPIRP